MNTVSHQIPPLLTTVEYPPFNVEIYGETEFLNSTSLLTQHQIDLSVWQPHWHSLIGTWGNVFLPMVIKDNLHRASGLTPGSQTWEITVNLVTNATIQGLNASYRGKNEPTDVLSFTLFNDSPVKETLSQLPIVQLGEVYVSTEWALNTIEPLQRGDKQLTHEKRMGLFSEYLLERITHGILHLLGMHHDTMTDYNKVVTIQKRVLHEVCNSKI